jgi:hypothetical protein
MNSKPLSQILWKNGDSHFWESLMKVKNNFLQFGTFTVKNGEQIRFWEDIWLGGMSLRRHYPNLFNIARHKQITVAEVFSSSPINLSWQRDIVGNNLTAWNRLLPHIASIALSQD